VRFVKRKNETIASAPLVGAAGFFLDVVEKVNEGRIGNYRYVAFEITPDEIEKRMPKAREKTAETMEIDLPSGLPEREVERLKRLVREGKMDYWKAVEEAWRKKTGEPPDFYVPENSDFAAEILLNEQFASDLSFPRLEVQARPEEGYGLPEFSLYGGPDARSYIGRWYYSHGGQGGEIDPAFQCFATSLSPEDCRKLLKKIRKLEENAERKGRQLIVAYWKE